MSNFINQQNESQNEKNKMQIVKVTQPQITNTQNQQEEKPKIQIMSINNQRILSREEALTTNTIHLYPAPRETKEKRDQTELKIIIPQSPKIQERISEQQKENKLKEQVTLALENAYEQRVRIIVNEINNRATTPIEKLNILYKWFLNNVFYWDNYPKNGVKANDYYIKDNNINYSYPYNTKECAIVKGFSLCLGISNAFADIATRLGIDVEKISNNEHVWNMIYTESGPLFIDLAQAVRHFTSTTPEKRLFDKKQPIDQKKAQESYLKPLDKLYKMYSHNHGQIDGDTYKEYYESLVETKVHSK